MIHLIVGDGHYCGAPGEAERWGHLLARARDARVGELSILGDFFELWIGLPDLTTSWQEALFAPLRALKDDGALLRYVVGNKDYYVEEWNRRHQLFDEVRDPGCTVDSPVGPLHLAHGDLVNHADRQYRAWRAVSRSSPVSLIARAIPRRWLRRAADGVATRLRSTNASHKSYFPEAQLRARARELPAGRATLIYGHFHEHHRLTEADKTIITLPFLGSENAGIVVDDAGIERFPKRS